MNHRRDTHGKTKEKCKYNVPPSTCKHGPAECWNDHSSIPEDSEEYKCTVCDDKFTSIPQMRRHRKKEHIESVPICRETEKGKKCSRSDQYCWYSHNMPKPTQIPSSNMNSKTPTHTSFWEGPKTPNPGE